MCRAICGRVVTQLGVTRLRVNAVGCHIGCHIVQVFATVFIALAVVAVVLAVVAVPYIVVTALPKIVHELRYCDSDMSTRYREWFSSYYDLCWTDAPEIASLRASTVERMLP